MIKGSIQEEDITIVNINAPNMGVPKHIEQILTDIKGEINNITIVAGEFNAPTYISGQIIQIENQ